MTRSGLPWLAVLLLFAGGCAEGPTKFIGAHNELEATSDAGGAANLSTTTESSTTSGASTSTTGLAPGNCEVGALPAGFDAPDIYTKYTETLGIPALAPEVVNDQALVTACRLARQMLSLRPDVATEMLNNGARIAVMGQGQQLRDLPELQNLSSAWNNTRGIGASFGQPLTVGAEENLLCSDNDVHRGEVIFVHSFAHAMRSLGIARIESDFDDRLETAYDEALFEGKWLDAFSRESFPQYWAEGVQSWLDVNLAPPNEIHNEINTRLELQSYDPVLYNIIAEYLPGESADSDCFAFLP